MEVTLFTMCKAATLEPLGFSNILRTFDVHRVDRVPTTLKCSFVAGTIRFDRHEIGHHDAKLEFVNDDGKPISDPLEFVISISEVQDGLSSGIQSFAWQLDQVEFKAFGDYSMNLFIDGEKRAGAPIFVRHPTKEPI